MTLMTQEVKMLSHVLEEVLKLIIFIIVLGTVKKESLCHLHLGHTYLSGTIRIGKCKLKTY